MIPLFAHCVSELEEAEWKREPQSHPSCHPSSVETYAEPEAWKLDQGPQHLEGVEPEPEPEA